MKSNGKNIKKGNVKNIEEQQKMFGSYDFKDNQLDSNKDDKVTSKDDIDE